MVLQDTWLFKGTIMENIRYGRLDATDEEVIAAAKAARAHHFIRTLPGGYQMELNEDASNVAGTETVSDDVFGLSGGQSDPDSGESQITSPSIRERKFNPEGHGYLMKGRTSCHRPSFSTIRDSDSIPGSEGRR